MEQTPTPDNKPPSMLEEVHQDLGHESTTLGHSLWKQLAIIGVIVLALGGVGWYAVSMLLAPRPAPVITEPVVQNSNNTPVQIGSSTVETEGAGKTQIVDEETRRQLEAEASAALRASQQIAVKEGPRQFPSLLANHMEQMRRMRNYLFINVQTLLLGNKEKEKLLSDYMNTLIAETKGAKDRLAQINTDIALLKTDYTSYTADQKRFQEAYKQSIINYDPKGTADNLEAFISSQSAAAETFARMRALQSMADIYTKMLAATDTKMKFIAANKEALLKEVQVVDIKSLEEKLILSEKEWLQTLQQ